MTASKAFTLASYWHSVSEGGQEQTLEEVVREIFGYQTALT